MIDFWDAAFVVTGRFPILWEFVMILYGLKHPIRLVPVGKLGKATVYEVRDR